MNEYEQQTYRELIITKLDSLDKKIDRVEKKGDETLIQAKKTNGRVTLLEKVKSYVLGFLAAVVVIASVVMPMVDALIKAGKLF